MISSFFLHLFSVDVRAGASRGEHHLRTGEDPETSRQLAHDFNEREEYLRYVTCISLPILGM